MKTISIFFYNIFIHLFDVYISFYSLFNKKATLRVTGLRQQTPFHKLNTSIWFHCASLGEFEQARPLIERIKKEYPQKTIVLTFFSSSGFEVQKNYPLADAVLYLPTDTPGNARSFIESIQPSIAFFVKYDLWYNYINTLHHVNVPLVLFSSTFRKKQVFFKWYGGLFRDMLSKCSKIFVQNEASKTILHSIGISSEVAFDTRYDRVLQILSDNKHFPVIENFKANKKLLVAGSTWAEDEKIIISAFKRNLLSGHKLLIAPHTVTDESIQALVRLSSPLKTILYSNCNSESIEENDVLVIDSVGMLSHIYRYATIAYVGGGFNKHIHNVLEPAVFGVPVVFGKKHSKSLEATELISVGGAFAISDEKSFENLINKLVQEENFLLGSATASRLHVHTKQGGTTSIWNSIKNLIA